MKYTIDMLIRYHGKSQNMIADNCWKSRHSEYKQRNDNIYNNVLHIVYVKEYKSSSSIK